MSFFSLDLGSIVVFFFFFIPRYKKSSTVICLIFHVYWERKKIFQLEAWLWGVSWFSSCRMSNDVKFCYQLKSHFKWKATFGVKISSAPFWMQIFRMFIQKILCISRYIHTSSPPSMRLCRGLTLSVCSSVLLQRSLWDLDGRRLCCGDFRPRGRKQIAHVASCEGQKITLAFSENIKAGFSLESKCTN